jgi:hypothetical protein
MNKTWHAENKMPPKATLEQRIQWHREHQMHCACREVPRSLLQASRRLKSESRYAGRSPDQPDPLPQPHPQIAEQVSQLFRMGQSTIPLNLS